jgi:hypothetical protein
LIFQAAEPLKFTMDMEAGVYIVRHAGISRVPELEPVS